MDSPNPVPYDGTVEETGMFINPIEEDIYLVIGDAYQSNSTLFVSRNEALLVDAMGSRHDAEKLREWVEEHLHKDVRFIVSTHYFCDHLAGLNLFPGATVIAHYNYLETFNSELYCSAEEKTHFREPDFLLSDELTIRWGKRELNIFHNPAHTPSTLGIDVKDANLLLIGDSLVGNIVYLAYSTPENFVGAFDRLRSRMRDLLIPGHGNIRSKATLENAQFYLSQLEERTKKARACTEGEQSLLRTSLKECLPPGVDATPFEKVFHDRNLQRILEQRFFAAD